MKHAEIKQKYQEKLSELFKDCGVFFAFSNEQFEKNKTPLQEGEKYVSLGAGGYLPKSKLDAYINGMKGLNKWEKEEIKKEKKGIEEHILYELHNHECFYTCDIGDAMDVLPYNRKRVLEVYNKYKDEAFANL